MGQVQLAKIQLALAQLLNWQRFNRLGVPTFVPFVGDNGGHAIQNRKFVGKS